MPISNEELKNYSPLQKIHGVFTAPPGVEAVMGLAMPPEISLFSAAAPETASIVKAKADHDRMTAEFGKRDIDVYPMREVIGRRLAKKNKSKLETPEHLLKELRRRVVLLHDCYGLGNLEHIYQELRELLFQDVQTMGADAAVAINSILTNCMDVDGNYKEFDIGKPPAANFMFWRDTNHILHDRLSTHRMFYDIRNQEVALAKIGFEALGLKYASVVPHEETYPEDLDNEFKRTIEGGDVGIMELNGSRYAMIGQAERTSWKAVEAWYHLHKSLFSLSGEGLIPAVVQGPKSNTQDQMHLDTFVQQVAPGVIIHCREITQARKLSVLTLKKGVIERVDEQIFADWINRQASDTYEMSKAEQENHGANVLTDAGQIVYVTRDDTPEIAKFIEEHVAEVVILAMNDLTNLYGGAHCSTSEFRK